MLLSAHLDRAGRCKDAARLAVDAAKHFAAEGRAAALQKKMWQFKACQKTELPLLWVSCGNLLTYQLLLLLRIRDLKPTWTTWNVQSSLIDEAEAPGHDEESQNALLKAFRMDRNNGDAWEGLVDIVSVPWDIKEARFDPHFKRKNPKKGKHKRWFFVLDQRFV